MAKDNLNKIEGMLLISAHHDVRGLKHWIEELQKRKIPAIIQVEPNFLSKNCSFIKELSIICDHFLTILNLLFFT